MKKIWTLVLAVVLGVSLVGCSETPTSEKEIINVSTLNGNKETVIVEVPYQPKRLAVLDMAALDIIDAIEEGEAVVGSASTSIDYLSSYSEDKEITNLGTIKEVDLEAVAKAKPDVIFIGGRLSASYDALSEIAPVIYITTDTTLGVVESTKQNAMTIASLFGKENEIETLMQKYDERIKTLSSFAKDKNVIMSLVTSGSINVLGNDGRCSLIGNEIGFTNIGVSEEDTSTHGNESSFELVVALNPNYLFVLDRDSAINAEGAKLAKEIVENELVKQTSAYINKQIIYLEHANVWYTAEGGIQALDYMLQDIEKGLSL